MVGPHSAQHGAGDEPEQVVVPAGALRAAGGGVSIDVEADLCRLELESPVADACAQRYPVEIAREAVDGVCRRDVLLAGDACAVDLHAGQHVTRVHRVLDDRADHREHAQRHAEEEPVEREPEPARSNVQPRGAGGTRAAMCLRLIGSLFVADPAPVQHPRQASCPSENDRMRDELRRRLIELGASDDDLVRAEALAFVPLLALERRLLPGDHKYDVGQLAAAAGIEEAWAQRLWRAVGFPDVPLGVAAFSDRDVAAARQVVREAAEWHTDAETLLQRIRATSGAAARIAAVEAEVIADFVQRKRADGESDDDIALGFLSDERLDRLAALVDYVLRIQLRAAVWRRLALQADPDIAVAIGFADLAGYTALSGALDPVALSQLLNRWEAVAYDTIVEHGARVVKTIGDEVMFVGLPREVLASAIALRKAVTAEGLPPVRAGLAAGPVIPREGDFYGPVVNLASRLTAIAPANRILVPASMRGEVPEGEFRFVPLGEQFLRGIGNVETCALEA